MSSFSAYLRRLTYAALTLAGIFGPATSHAVPLYARQTGLGCSACHFGGNFPELTKTGREFKLMGYTLGNRQTIPLAGMLQLGMTRINDNSINSAQPSQAKNGDLVASQISLFTGGKITDNIGAFVQWTSGYDVNQNGDQYVRHGGIDNTDIRFADKTKVGGKDLIYGVSLNNGPSVQDIFNTTPAWNVNPSATPSGPFQGYGINTANGSVTPTLIDGGLAAQVYGIGAYADYNDFLYAELSGYQTADGIFSVFRAGQDTTANRYTIRGANPYWRLALHGDSGPHSWEVGTYGMVADVYSDQTTADSLTDRFKDYALDAQYQYAKGPHRASVQGTWIHEDISWNANTGNSNLSDTRETWRLRGNYMYRNKIGGSLGFFSNTGSADANLYGTPTGTPDTSGYILEADYIPIQQVKLALQYTGYNKFNGTSGVYTQNPDGSDRRPSDNNTVYLLGWLMF